MTKNTLAWNGAAFALTDYLGTSVSIAGSTTSGLQEWLALCAANGMPGEAVASLAHPFTLTSTVTVPDAGLMHVDIIGRIVTSGIGAHSAFKFSSFNCSYFRHRGVIEYDGTAPVVQMIPVTAGPGGVAIDFSEIHFGMLSVYPSAGVTHAVYIDPTHGAINNNKLSFRMINGFGKAQFGVWVISPNNQVVVTSCFGQNDIDIGVIQGAVVAAVQEGNAGLVPSQMAIGTNKWEIGAITTAGNLGYGFITCGLGNIVRIGAITNNGATTIGTGVYFAGGTFLNQVQVTQNDAAQKFLNSGAASNVVVP